MSSPGERVSAFAMYSQSQKRKSLEAEGSKKFKKMSKLPDQLDKINGESFCSSASDDEVDVEPVDAGAKIKVSKKTLKTDKSASKRVTALSKKVKTKKLLIKGKKLLKNDKQSVKSFKGEPAASAEADEEQEQNTNSINPIKETQTLFEWLIHPLSLDEFFKINWEKAPLHIQRGKKNYYKILLSTPLIDEVLRKFNVLFTKNLDITSYSSGQRETHNPPGRALPSVVWDYYSNGCSIRMLNPQTFIPKIHTLNSTLQEFFGCFVGANFYLTPPGSQGFAPHYDDIEAFILQIEGKKRWRLYKPRNEEEHLPRYSSENFNQEEIGRPILDVILNAGDILYFPRGTIHQGETLDESHSLHLTLSVYQKNCWADFIEKLVPAALNSAISQNSQLREGLPLGYLNNIGLVHKVNGSKSKDNEFRRKFVETTKDLLHKVIDMIDVDAAADQMAKGHIHDCLPPVLAPVEQECSALKDGEVMVEEGRIENRVEIEPDTMIRLTRAHCARLVEEDNSFKLYYSSENSKEYHEYEPQFLEVEENLVPAIKKIILMYPEFIKVDDLPIDGEDNKVQVARDLWEKCIVLTDRPLPIIEFKSTVSSTSQDRQDHSCHYCIHICIKD
ncbi:ribosomal oxygenase 1 isoform X1 [Microplitis demolitor]|uniref:ribosomal oxygenase 1 isoform X1 n=2 Tax=Microplitis demolitor TaxID=69319 RepID=UPI0004CD0CF6|nr:ribosomal oxygenase 1 isoform X1 [Microplitis demolitor]